MGQDVWFSSKDTISKDYDQTFKLLFQKVYDEEYRTAFEKAGLTYRYAVASIPTLLVFRNGQLVNRSVGLISREDVLKLVQA